MKRAFTRLEEAVYHVERMYTPWNIQVEIETRERIDRDRLRAAVREAYDVHPIAKAHKRRGGKGGTDYDWEVPDEAPVPIEVVEASDVDLDALRQRFYGDGIDLSTAPPLRLLVVRNGGESGDLLWFCSSHVPVDGMGAYRILQAICTAYRGEDPATGRFGFEESGEVLDGFRPDSRRRRARLLGKTAGRLGYLFDPPSRLTGAEDPAVVGWRYRHRRLDERVVDALLDGDDASVNDYLLVAMHLTLDRWNREAGTAAEKLSVMMPVNLRPREWFYEGVGLYTLFESVTTEAADRRSAAQAVARVTDQTQRIKSERPYLGYLEWLNLVPEAVPLSVKKRLPKLLDGPGERLLDTAVLSNLGRLPEPLPALSGERPESLWCTPPCWLPTPVSIGVVTVGGEMQLGFRYAQSAFDGQEADTFADRYCERVADVV
ncbi:hypothetical protein HWV23_11880 [Natronomonas halophila]|uniref:hypothetical protein n=1 Tax=Natronomonas halophila TaxID=2747817 RepID=UPI0015B38EBF|nr:hypothetical protein [Natronomonas halophila]QLD86394.1 hypothetical protein HWV23_11880 [Natronomonas halophila]